MKDARRQRECGERQEDDAGGFVAVVMAVVNGFVAGVFVVGIDLEGFVNKQRVKQIEPRVLVPAWSLVDVGVAKHQDAEEQNSLFALCHIRGSTTNGYE